MRIRPLVLALSLLLCAGLPAMAAKKYKAPKQPHAKKSRAFKPRKTAGSMAKRAQVPKRPKVKVQKHRKLVA
jgi:hypothetical protein